MAICTSKVAQAAKTVVACGLRPREYPPRALGRVPEITVTITNHGGLTATDVRTTLSLPAALRSTAGTPTSFRTASLAPGQTQTSTVAITAVRASARNVTQANTSSRTPDAAMRDNFTTANTTTAR